MRSRKKQGMTKFVRLAMTGGAAGIIAFAGEFCVVSMYDIFVRFYGVFVTVRNCL